jgi:hypothetical protein
LTAIPYCVLVLPPRESESADARRLATLCQKLAAEASYRIKVLRCRKVLVVGGSGRKMNVLVPDDAAELYRMVHFGPVLVAAFGSARISIDPSREPPNRRETRPLETFLLYKASFGLIRGDADLPSLFARFEAWREVASCTGSGDPRVLPLHVFDAGSDDLELDTQAGTDRFRQKFGSSGRRVDECGRIWEKGVPHGRDELEVAGCALPAGMHWDVSAKRKAFKIANAREVWRVERGGYVNVYPDAGLRGPSSIRQDRVRRLWPSSSRPQKMPLHRKGH